MGPDRATHPQTPSARHPGTRRPWELELCKVKSKFAEDVQKVNVYINRIKALVD